MSRTFAYFVRSYRVTFLIIIALAIFGVSTVFSLPRESTPEIEVPFAAVITAYPGAATRDVEELVTKPIEDDLADLEGVKQITSSSRLGLSSINIEFNAEENKDDALRRLREAVSGIHGLPENAEDPQVIEINFSNEPIVSIGLSGINDEHLLTNFAKDVAKEIESINGVSTVDVVGGKNEQITVEVDPAVLAAHNLSLGQLLGTLASNNLNAPLGQVDTDKFHYDVRLTGRFENISDVANTPIRVGNGQTVLLKEIADVRLEVPKSTSTSRISIDRQPSTPAVTLQVHKKTGGNIINIVDAATAKVKSVAKDTLPDSVAITTFADRADDIRTSLHDVTQSGIQTFIIVFLLLWLFLGWKEAAITATAVPFTFFMAFIVFRFTGITLNGISLFSLILALGLLVDTAIVVVEGIHSRQYEPDLDAVAIDLVDQFKRPLAAGVLTTVAAFFPMLLVSGIIGEFLRTIPIVLSATLISSLIVALAFLPTIAVRILSRWPTPPDENRWFNVRYQKLRNWYTNFIDRALKSRRFQNRFIAALVILMVIGLSLPFTGLLNTGLFPDVDIDFTLGNVELPPGSNLAQTQVVMDKVEQEIRQIPEVKSFSINAGAATSVDIGGAPSSENLGSFLVNLNPERKRTSLEINQELRDRFSKITEAKVEVSEVSAGPPTSSPVELRLIGPDLDVLDAQSQRIVHELASIPGAIEADRNLKNSAGQFNFKLNRDELAKAGLSASDVAQTLRTALFGVEATSFLNTNGDEVKVQLAALPNTVDSIDKVKEIKLTTPTGEQIPISRVADINLETSISTILHTDGERAITISSKVAEGYNANQITKELQNRIPSLQIPPGYEVKFGGEQQQTEETFTQLYQSMVIAIIAILAILVIEFNSYRQPLIIAISIPLALIGVLFGLLILGGQLNFAAFIGLVSLTGIVVNNAILLVDRANYNMEHGATPEAAMIQATGDRLRPIILTTATTAAGVAPLIFVDEFFRDLSLTLMTGLLFSTVLTLALIPILYVRQQKKMLAKQANSKKPGSGQTHQVVV